MEPATRVMGGAERGATCAVGVMARTPHSGRSKTRLCPPFTPDGAAALSAAFLRDIMGKLSEAALAAPVIPHAAYAPRGSEGALEPHLPPGTALVPADGSAPAPDDVRGFGRCLLHAVIGLELVELDPWCDVDDAAGLSRLCTEAGAGAAPATWAALARLGLRAEPAP